MTQGENCHSPASDMPGFRRATDLLRLNGLIIWQFYTTLYNINQLAILYNFVKHLCFTDFHILTFMVIRRGILLCVIFYYFGIFPRKNVYSTVYLIPHSFIFISKKKEGICYLRERGGAIKERKCGKINQLCTIGN